MFRIFIVLCTIAVVTGCGQTPVNENNSIAVNSSGYTELDSRGQGWGFVRRKGKEPEIPLSQITMLEKYNGFYLDKKGNKKKKEVEDILNFDNTLFSIEELEEAMQKVMDAYAGGIGSNYQYNEKQLALADEKIDQIIELSNKLKANDMHELMFVYELKDRLIICKSLIAHLQARKETRWHSFAENLDYPEKNDDYLKYVNSKIVDGKLTIIFRDLVNRGDRYEHCN